MVVFQTDFVDNRQPRCACVLVLDTSGSMSGTPIDKLNEGLQVFAQELHADPLAKMRVEVALVNFPPVKPTTFCSAGDFSPPILSANGATPLGEAVSLALSLIETRKGDYRDHGIEYYRPWIFILTDGEPTDAWKAAAASARQAMADRRVVVFAVGVPGAKFDILEQFSTKPPLHLKDLKFRDMFVWLTASLRAVAGSNSHSGGAPNTNVMFEAPSGWGDLDG
jgi:uncharacterized protein YegL